MINTKTTAFRAHNGSITMKNMDGDEVATFASDAFFYIITGFKTVDAYNEYQDEQPTKFLVWPRQH